MDECLQEIILDEFRFLSDFIINKSLFDADKND